MAERKTNTSTKAKGGKSSAPAKKKTTTAAPKGKTASAAKKSSAAADAPNKKATATTTKATKATAANNKPKAKDHGSQDDSLYTKPDLRARLKDQIQAGEKGGRAGQWSARKSQLLAHEYEAQGGGYTGKKRGTQQKNLEKWTEEKWTTADDKKAIRGGETARYLPKKAWDKLSPAEKKATDTKKRTASKKGEQFVANTDPAKKARKKASSK